MVVDNFHQLKRTNYFMARVILEVPLDKMRAFLQATVNLGIDQSTIRSKELNRRRRQKKGTLFTLNKIASSFILFDWEFFSNELEYE